MVTCTVWQQLHDYIVRAHVCIVTQLEDIFAGEIIRL